MSGEAAEPQEGKAPTSPAAAVQPPPSGAADGAPHVARHLHAHHSTIQFRFLEQLTHRNVIRVGILYLVVCWLILDPVHVVFHMLEVPAWANRLVVILMAVGLPAVLLFAWVYEITPEGLKPTAEVDPHRSLRQQTGQRLNRAIVVVMVVALAYFAADRFWLSGRTTTEQVATPAASVARATTPGATTISDKSVAVLPFVDMSEKKDQEYFSDGLSEELINMLTKVSDLRVPARTSSFYFKGKSEDIPTIARRLMVAHVLEGSVRRSGTHLRVTAQLVRADNGYHVWSETFDRKMDDLFKVQDEIASSVVQALKVRLLPDEKLGATRESELQLTPQTQVRTRRPLAVKADSYQDYLLGRYYWNKADEPNLRRSIELYRQALAKDPQNALAEAGIAGSYTDLSDWYAPPRAVMPEAKAAAMRALELDESLSAAHNALCLVLTNYEWNWSAAERECRRAIELNPNSADAHDTYGLLLAYVGHAQEAAAELRRAEELDPLSFRIYSDGALTAFLARNYAVAAEQATRSIDLAPDYFVVRGYLAFIYVQMGRNEDAVTQAEKGAQLADSALMKSFLGYTYAATGRPEQARKITDQLIRERTRRYVCAYEIGTAELWLGAKDEAFRWFETAYDDRSFCIPTTKFDPRLDPVRSDPRYLSLIRRVGFPEGQIPSDRGRSTRSPK